MTSEQAGAPEQAGIEPDRPEVIAPGVVRVTAANAGVMTGPGTNTYLVGNRDVAVIDPGPDDPRHLEAVLAAADGRIRWVLVTHTHPDHSPGAAALSERAGAIRLGFASRDGFEADQCIEDGYELRLDDCLLRAIHTPGHASNHLCFLLDRSVASASSTRASSGQPVRLLFTGDHVMQGSTVVINPPDGDMIDYLASLRRIGVLDPPADAIAPGHGHLLADPASVIDATIEHRLQRERKVVDALRSNGSGTVASLVGGVYADVGEVRHPIARRSLWAHLRALAVEGRVEGDPDDIDAEWRWINRPGA